MEKTEVETKMEGEILDIKGGTKPRCKLTSHAFSARLCPEERGDFAELFGKAAATKTTAQRSPSRSIRSSSSGRSPGSRNTTPNRGRTGGGQDGSF